MLHNYIGMHYISTRWYMKSSKMNISLPHAVNYWMLPPCRKHMKFREPQVAISIYRQNHGSINLHWSTVACQRSPSNGFHGFFQAFIFLSNRIGPSVCSLVQLGVLSAVTTKSVVSWGVTPCSPVDVHRRFGETCFQHEGRSNESANRVVLFDCLFSVAWWVSSSIFKMEVVCFSETSVNLYRITQRHTPEDNIHLSSSCSWCRRPGPTSVTETIVITSETQIQLWKCLIFLINWWRCVYKILIQGTYAQLVRTHIRRGHKHGYR
jgi:hypothetical protein